MANYILVDTMNMFFRARHAVKGDLDTKIGIALHITFNSIKKAWTTFEGDHVVFCLDGRSWRKDIYPPYKRNRKNAKDSMTEREQEEDKLFFEIFDEFKNFVISKTNCTVLHNPILEADDLIAGWISQYPNDNHVIISTDGDFAQLIAPNVKQYNGVNEITITHEGYFDDNGKPVVDKKSNEVKPAPDPEWLLFEKCIRGDTSDNIFSAYPGVRKKGTKNKIGLLEAYDDKKNKGYSWNNLMLQRWVDHEGIEHRVLDDYNRNVVLCDLTAQPEPIKEEIKNTIITSSVSKNVGQVGVKMMKFCGKWDLQRIGEQIQYYVEPFNASYRGEL